MTNQTTITSEESYRPGLFGEPGEEAEPTNWVLRGILAGAAGAAMVSVFFLLIDLVEGRPLWTPGALGAALFLREALAAGSSPSAAIVAGYTAFHGAFFLTAGLAASYFAAERRLRLGPRTGLALAGILFLALQAIFLTFLGLEAPDLAEAFGAGRITTANLLAAGAMAAAVLR